MMDGSLTDDGKTPADFEYNVAVTREVVELAHARGVSVEGELGSLGGIEDGDGSGEVHLTDPDEADEFVRARASTRWPSRSAPPRRLQVHARSPTARCWRWTASRRSTSACPTRTS